MGRKRASCSPARVAVLKAADSAGEALGRSGSITLLLRGLKDLPPEERPRMGEQLNQLRRALEQELDARLAAVNRQAKAKALAPTAATRRAVALTVGAGAAVLARLADAEAELQR